MGRIRSLWLFLGLVLFAVSFYDVTADVIPSENECRPYIEKAIHELKNTDSTATDIDSIEDKTGDDDAIETITTSEAIVEEGGDDNESSVDAATDKSQEEGESTDSKEEVKSDDNTAEDNDGDSKETVEENDSKEDDKEEQAAEENDTKEEAAAADDEESVEAQEAENVEGTEANNDDENDSKEAEKTDSVEVKSEDEDDSKEEEKEQAADTKEDDDDSKEEGTDDNEDSAEENQNTAEADDKSNEEQPAAESLEESENNAAENDDDDDDDSKEATDDKEEPAQSEDDSNDSKEDEKETTAEDNDTKEAEEEAADENEDSVEEKVRSKRSVSDEATPESDDDNDTKEDTAEQSDNDTKEEDDDSQENVEGKEEADTESDEAAANDEESSEKAASEDDEPSEEETMPEEELTLGFEIPKNLRSRTHITNLLGLDAESSIKENALKRTGDVILKELKRVYDNAIKPLESMYKYRDLSNRHFGDPEIFSKPLIVLMGPYSGGKSTILNYLTDNEYTPNSIRSGAEPSPAYFNILMHGDEPEVLDGTQLAADWTFSGLQKFGQGLMDRLRGQKLPSKILERVNIVEIPGILEVRKQVSRYFPFNDACQWFIDRADIIFLVYDPAKLDVGPETEAILDQLKGREYQTRILLNKADTVKPEELLRVQSALIWNISPLMSSAQPPVMYTVSLWSHPFDQGAPIRLLQAQERALLSDLREAIDKRIENKIASARRFAVRIRNHAKMVDCYLTTYYNQKTLFSNKKQVSDKIIEHPQNYNIYEGLSTLTNISRYDLPDPEVYLDFFRLNPLYEFKKLSETCTYFKGCPINKLDIAIAYDLPELVGKYKKLLEENYIQLRKEFEENCNDSTIEPPVKLNSR